jgi:hypothetical protein
MAADRSLARTLIPQMSLLFVLSVILHVLRRLQVLLK